MALLQHGMCENKSTLYMYQHIYQQIFAQISQCYCINTNVLVMKKLVHVPVKLYSPVLVQQLENNKSSAAALLQT